MAKRGRPSKYTPELARKILDLLCSGMSLRRICLPDDMPAESTVRGWNLDDIDGFSAQYARARRECSFSRLDISHDALADKEAMLYTDADGNRRVDSGAVNQARAYADYVRWEASKLIPEMADKKQVEHSGHVGMDVLFSEAAEDDDA